MSYFFPGTSYFRTVTLRIDGPCARCRNAGGREDHEIHLIMYFSPPRRSYVDVVVHCT